MSKLIIDVVKLWIPTLPVTIKKIKIPKNGKYPALYEWLNTADFNHSNKIKSGHYMQAFILELIINAPNTAIVIPLKYITISNGESKEMDILFQIGTVIYYREVKCNLNLDSEKMPATFNKIYQISEALSKIYTQKIDAGCLQPVWLTSEKNIEGFNNFISILGYDNLTIEEYSEIGNLLGKIIKTSLGQI